MHLRVDETTYGGHYTVKALKNQGGRVDSKRACAHTHTTNK